MGNKVKKVEKVQKSENGANEPMAGIKESNAELSAVEMTEKEIGEWAEAEERKFQKTKRPLSDYSRIVNGEVLAKNNFKIFATPSVTTLIRENGDSIVFMDTENLKGKGFHICRMVRRDVEQFVEDNPDYNYNKFNVDNLATQALNTEVIKKYEGMPIFSIDVNNCYWDTLYNRGFITKKTYLSGLKRNEWKTGRNASIGALDKTETESIFEKGVLVRTVPIEKRPELTGIRAEIVQSVHEMFLELMGMFSDKWLMYFTDCLYVPDMQTMKRCAIFFEERGYKTKMDTYHLDRVEGKKIIWHDYKKNRMKSYEFREGFSGEGILMEERLGKMKPSKLF